MRAEAGFSAFDVSHDGDAKADFNRAIQTAFEADKNQGKGMKTEDKAFDFLKRTAEVKGDEFVQIVSMASISKTAMAMIGAASLPYDEKLKIAQIQAEFAGLALSLIVEKLGLVPREVMECADEYTRLAYIQAKAAAAQKASVPGNSTIN